MAWLDLPAAANGHSGAPAALGARSLHRTLQVQRDDFSVLFRFRRVRFDKPE